MTVRRGWLVLGLALLLAACSPSGRILSNEPTPAPSRPLATAVPLAVADPQPIAFPADEAPHQRLTEWWYYTGHLRAEDGRRFGFEFVVFRAERGAFPVTWASHLALTDEDGGRFLHQERTEIGPQVDGSDGSDGSAGAGGFDLAVSGASGGTPWRISGALGQDSLEASADAFAIDLALDAGGRAPVLHDRDGFVDFGAAGGSYYYSRTRMDATGTLTLDGESLAVEGLAWFDHQWGDFIAVGAGGWDWFAINLDDRTDITLSLVRDREGGYPLVYGTLVRPDGRVEHLERDAFNVEVTARWTSPETGSDYPAGWLVTIPAEALEIRLTPTLNEQELDTRDSTGVVYWEGSQVVEASRDGEDLGGEAYVELTGYGPGLVADR